MAHCRPVSSARPRCPPVPACNGNKRMDGVSRVGLRCQDQRHQTPKGLCLTRTTVGPSTGIANGLPCIYGLASGLVLFSTGDWWWLEEEEGRARRPEGRAFYRRGGHRLTRRVVIVTACARAAFQSRPSCRLATRLCQWHDLPLGYTSLAFTSPGGAKLSSCLSVGLRINPWSVGGDARPRSPKTSPEVKGHRAWLMSCFPRRASPESSLGH